MAFAVGQIDAVTTMDQVKIVSYTAGKSKELGTVRLDDAGEVVFGGELPPRIRDVVTDAYKRAKSPKQFLMDLPRQFNGTYIRAMRVKSESSPEPQSYRDKLRRIQLDWDPELHPRDDSGKFTESGGGGTTHGSHGPEYSKLLSTIRQPDAGFTVHAVTGKQPVKGYALSMFKGRETVKPVKDLTLLDLARFAKQNKDLLSQKDNYFGAWHNPANHAVYLDVSKIVSTPAEAERLGREHSQLAYFDLGHGRSVDIEKEAA